MGATELETPRLKNRTRTSRWIPVKLLARGRVDLLAIYGLMYSSEVGREAIRNNGSYRWTDLMYANNPRGLGPVGKYVDRALLRSRGGRGMRNRFQWIQQGVASALARANVQQAKVRILSVPMGLGRDVLEPIAAFQKSDAGRRVRVELHAMDLDPAAVRAARAEAADLGVRGASIRCADGLDPEAYPAGPFDLIVTVGFLNYLNDEEARAVLATLVSRLSESGEMLVHSTVPPSKLVRYILSVSEFHGIYRGVADVARLFDGLPVHVEGSLEPAQIDALLVVRRKVGKPDRAQGNRS